MVERSLLQWSRRTWRRLQMHTIWLHSIEFKLARCLIALFPYERMNWFPKSLWPKWRAQQAPNRAVTDTHIDVGGGQEVDFGAFCLKQGLKEPLSSVGSHYLEDGYLFREWVQDQGLLSHPELNPTSVEQALRQAKRRAEHAFTRCGASMSLPMLVVAFPSQELLWATTESLVGESYGPSQARFFSDPFPHLFAALVGARDERVLVHEFTHAIFCRYRLPRWLDEGLALLAEETVFGAPELVRGVAEWDQLNIDEVTINQFFDGALFDQDNLSYRRFAYWHAFVVVRNLYKANPDAFGEVLSQYPVDTAWDLWLQKNFGLTRDDISGRTVVNPG